MYAIIETGSKQYRVQPGDTLEVELCSHDEGSIVFDRVLAVEKEDGVEVGRPTLEGVTVKGTLVEEFKDDKTVHYIRAIKEYGGRYLRVIMNANVNPHMVITLFFDRRIRKTS